MFVETTKDKSTRSLRSLTHESNNIVNNICSTCDLFFLRVSQCAAVCTHDALAFCHRVTVRGPPQGESNTYPGSPPTPTLSPRSRIARFTYSSHVRAEINQLLRTQTRVGKLLLCEPKSFVRRRRWPRRRRIMPSEAER